MKNFNLKNVLLSGLVFSLALCPQAFADDCQTGYVKGVNTGNCIKASGSCGSGCTYTIDEKGKAIISGNGNGRVGYQALSGGDIVNIEVKDGIKVIGGQAFRWVNNLQSISIPNTVTSVSSSFIYINSEIPLREIVIPDSVTNISYDNVAFGYYDRLDSIILSKNITELDNRIFGRNIANLVIPESVVSVKNNAVINSGTNLYCTAQQVESGICADRANIYERDGDNLIVYNKDGTIKGVYSDYAGITHDTIVDSYEKENEQTGKTEVFNGRGILTSSYAVNSDGSTSIYDANGKLTGLKNAREITPAQAAELTKPGKNNTVTLTFK